MRMGLRVVILIAVAAGVLAAEPLLLRYQFKIGQTLTCGMVMDQSTEVASSLTPGAPQKYTTRMEVEVYQKPTALKPGAAALEIGFNRFTAEMTMGGQKVPLPVVDDLKKIRLSLQIGERGQMSEAALQNPDELSEQARQLAGSMAKSMTQNAMVFPEKPVGVGESWSADQEVPAQIPGAAGLMMQVKSTYRLAAVETVRGLSCAKITTEIKLSLHGKAESAGLPLQVDLEGGGQGNNLFDLKNGRMVSSQASISLSADLHTSVPGPSEPESAKPKDPAPAKPAQDVSTRLKIDLKLAMNLKV
jgi:hypothetical protein